MEKRTLAALAVSFLVLAFYPMILQKFYPDYYQTRKPATAKSSPKAPSDIPPIASSPSPISAEKFQDGQDLVFQNERLKLQFNSKGGVIREISFPQFIDSETRKPLTLISLGSPAGAPTYVRLMDRGGEVQDFELSSRADAVTAHAALGEIKIVKEYVFHPDHYGVDFSLRFENNSGSPVELRYRLSVGNTIPARHSIDNQYLEANFYSSESGKDTLRHIKETKLGKTVESQGTLHWVAVKDRHFSILVKPRSGGFKGFVEGLGNHQLNASLLSEKITVPAHGSVQQEFLLYIGPNEIDELLPLRLDPIVNFGKLDAIGRVLVGGLELLHKIFRNYGVSIVVLTVLINLLLFPLTRLSYLSMKRMQLVQPHMAKLREQHKKNPEKLNKETMELYKKHKVNPFGGCLPMILQMPVFMALYVALSKSAILINSKLLWINDLSSPDSVVLPWTLPFLGNQIHVLPLVMVGAMFFQQKFTQVKIEGQDPTIQTQQKMMTVMMPIIFGFIFYTMPSGLVLYWLTNTVLMTGYQLHLKKLTLV